MRRWLSQRFDRAVRWRADEEISARVPEVVDDRIRQPTNEISWAVNELQRLGPQLAALESRVEEKRQGAAALSGTEPPSADAALLNEVRAEHERIRARLFTVTRYVERLERLESEVAEIRDQIRPR